MTSPNPVPVLRALSTLAVSPDLCAFLVSTPHFLPPPQFNANGKQLQDHTLLGVCFSVPSCVRVHLPLLVYVPA